MHRITAAALSFAAFLSLPIVAMAADDPVATAAPYPTLPCAGEPNPAYPNVGETPDVRVWRDGELKGWQVPACTGFARIEPNTLMATAGRFRAAGGMDEITGRLAQISKLKTVRYYAGSDELWKNLYTEAHALNEGVASGAAEGLRPDYTQNDLQSGRTLRYWQEENSLLSGIVYRLHVVERSETKLVYTIVNESPGKAMFMTVTEPGEFRQYYAIERENGDVWRYYSMVEAHISGPVTPASRSFQSRAIAYYRHIAGYPTEMAFNQVK